MARLELIFPPLTGVNYPYLSTAVLKAYVEANSAHTVGQHDLNMALVDWLLRPQTVRYYAAKAQAALDALQGPRPRSSTIPHLCSMPRPEPAGRQP